MEYFLKYFLHWQLYTFTLFTFLFLLFFFTYPNIAYIWHYSSCKINIWHSLNYIGNYISIYNILYNTLVYILYYILKIWRSMPKRSFIYNLKFLGRNFDLMSALKLIFCQTQKTKSGSEYFYTCSTKKQTFIITMKLY